MAAKKINFTLEELERWVNTDNFIVYDFETTGLSYEKGARIIDVGAYELKGNTIVSKFETLINPGFPIPKFITELTHIDDTMVKWKPFANVVIKEFENYIDGKVLCCHKADFDFDTMLKPCVRDLFGRELENQTICTLRAAKAFMPGKKHSLDEVYKNLIKKEPNISHRASADAMMTVEIALFMKQFFSKNYDEIKSLLENQ